MTDTRGTYYDLIVMWGCYECEVKWSLSKYCWNCGVLGYRVGLGKSMKPIKGNIHEQPA